MGIEAFIEKQKRLKRALQLVMGIMLVTLTISIVYIIRTATLEQDPTPYQILGPRAILGHRAHFMGLQAIDLERDSDGVPFVALADGDLCLQTLGAREHLRIYQIRLRPNIPVEIRLRWIGWDEVARG